MRQFHLLFLFIVNNTNAQTFTLSDSLFEKGDSLTRDIDFGFDHQGIRPGSKAILDSIAIFMNNYPKVNIEIAHHTDCRGSASNNAQLSKSRSQAIAQYLSQKVSLDRLNAVGYGETHPIITEKQILLMKTKEEQENAHQLNRRTVFIIRAK